jgi:hypothetical protein
MFQTKVVEKLKTHFLCSVTFFLNHAVCEMWKKILWSRAGHMTMWCMRQATNTRSQYVTHITFMLQQCLLELISVLRYTYVVHCLSSLEVPEF